MWKSSLCALARAGGSSSLSYYYVEEVVYPLCVPPFVAIVTSSISSPFHLATLICTENIISLLLLHLPTAFFLNDNIHLHLSTHPSLPHSIRVHVDGVEHCASNCVNIIFMHINVVHLAQDTRGGHPSTSTLVVGGGGEVRVKKT